MVTIVIKAEVDSVHSIGTRRSGPEPYVVSLAVEAEPGGAVPAGLNADPIRVFILRQYRVSEDERIAAVSTQQVRYSAILADLNV